MLLKREEIIESISKIKKDEERYKNLERLILIINGDFIDNCSIESDKARDFLEQYGAEGEDLMYRNGLENKDIFHMGVPFTKYCDVNFTNYFNKTAIKDLADIYNNYLIKLNYGKISGNRLIDLGLDKVKKFSNRKEALKKLEIILRILILLEIEDSKIFHFSRDSIIIKKTIADVNGGWVGILKAFYSKDFFKNTNLILKVFKEELAEKENIYLLPIKK